MLSRIVRLRRRLADQHSASSSSSAPHPATKEGPKTCDGDGAAVFPLKLIIMSATLRTADFTENAKLFPEPPPLIHVRVHVKERGEGGG
jgi:hypothetical protein